VSRRASDRGDYNASLNPIVTPALCRGPPCLKA